MADMTVHINCGYRNKTDVPLVLEDDCTLSYFVSNLKDDDEIGPSEKEWDSFLTSGSLTVDGKILPLGSNPEEDERLLTDLGVKDGSVIDILPDATVKT